MSRIGGWLDRGGGTYGEGICRMSRALYWSGAVAREAYCRGGIGLLEHRQRGDEVRPCSFEQEGGRVIFVMDGAVRGGNQAIAEAYREAGKGFADALEGSFALALLDEGRGELILSRSEDGGRPLYCREEEFRLTFSSEIKGILSLNPQREQVERERLLAYLCAPFRELPPEFLYRGVYEFPKGHTAVYHRLGELTLAHAPKTEGEMGHEPMDSLPDKEGLRKTLYEQLMLHDAPWFEMPPWKGKVIKQAETLLRSLLSECDPVWLCHCLGDAYPALIEGEKDAAVRVRRMAMIFQTEIWSRWVQVV